ncbi:hypothetical protein R1flu_011981 [Riccia fluitans]|uniref:Uncharacterized protein n=1 Tax=Riccia fluitans TaxID=41844 RepID=A0ABD1ZAH0_9MARC
MRILKLQAWEQRYLEKLAYLRKIECHWPAKALYGAAVSDFILWSAPRFVAASTIGTCILLGGLISMDMDEQGLCSNLASAKAAARKQQLNKSPLLKSKPSSVELKAYTTVSELLGVIKRDNQEHPLPKSWPFPVQS